MKAGLQIARDQSVIDVVIEWRDRMPSVYPTANISVQDREIRDGVWAGTVHLGREGLRETYPDLRGAVAAECIVGCPS